MKTLKETLKEHTNKGYSYNYIDVSNDTAFIPDLATLIEEAYKAGYIKATEDTIQNEQEQSKSSWDENKAKFIGE